MQGGLLTWYGRYLTLGRTGLGIGSEREGGFISGRRPVGDWMGILCVFSWGCVEQVLRIGGGCLSSCVWLSWPCPWRENTDSASQQRRTRGGRLRRYYPIKMYFWCRGWPYSLQQQQRGRVKTRLEEHSTCTTSTGARSGDGLQH